MAASGLLAPLLRGGHRPTRIARILNQLVFKVGVVTIFILFAIGETNCLPLLEMRPYERHGLPAVGPLR